MLYHIFERTVLAAVIWLGCIVATITSRKQKTRLVAVRRHRPEPWRAEQWSNSRGKFLL